MHSKDYLASELRKADLNEMAELAAKGYYHDYLSPLATPAMQLANDLAQAGTTAALELRARHLKGEFDARPEESEEWIKGSEGQSLIQRLARGK